ncbi:MAG: hypothetical protein IPK56_10940 [Elusimicrobia bacterium]|nr:hypothetical protein [Elusimicrobiota bacterium]
MLTSGPDTVDVTARAANTAPVAEAGAAVTVTVGDVVALDGSGSSGRRGAPLTYVGDFQERPAGSTATLTGRTRRRRSLRRTGRGSIRCGWWCRTGR